ncbi:hypothetical protein NDN08_006098 [Rhodosorus marinus]|uniref:Pentacotripeptide-repeat region of PRORP domain-containing protein n=1 Tax=Rhodosorus marinus TaxID=101924 RepID=A0AAV8UJR4_9RHOD|nr:hypothetical protein NDN08_006098 [Rhodosorus marinus]
MIGFVAPNVVVGRSAKGNDGICGFDRSRVVLSKYYVQYDQTEPDMEAPPISNVSTNDQVAFIFTLLRNGEVDYAKQRFVDRLRDKSLRLGTYSRLVTAFGSFDSVESAEKIHSLAKWRSDDPTSVLDNSLLKVYAKAGRIEDMLDAYGRIPAPSTACRCTVIKALGLDGRFLEAERYVVEDMRCINTLLHVYAEHEESQALQRVLARIDSSRKLSRDVRTYNVLLSFQKDPAKAERLLNEMSAAGLKPDVVSFTTLITLYGRRGEADLLLKTYQAMKDARIRPNVSTLNAAVFSLARLGRMEDSEKILRETEALGVYPNTGTYNRLIKLYTDKGELQRGRNLFEAMTRRDYKHTRDHYTYNSMLAGYAKEGRVYACEKMFQRMIDSGVAPNEVTYHTMMDAHSRKGKPFAVRKYLRMMARDGFAPSSRALGSMCVAWARTGNIEGAKAVLREMSRLDLPPSQHGYAAIIKAHVSRNELAEALSVMEAMTRKGVTPNIVIYNILLDGYSREGMVGNAEALFSSMEVEPNVISFTTLMSAHVRGGTPQAAEAVFLRMLDAEVAPNAKTYGVLLESCKRTHNYKGAQKVLKRMKQSRIRPTVVIYGTLIAIHVKRLDIEGALNVYKTMLEEGTPPNRICYMTLIYALLKAGKTEQANMLYEEALSQKIYLPMHLYTDLTATPRSRRRPR